MIGKGVRLILGLALVGFVTMAAPNQAVAQDAGTISGQVTEATSGQPLQGARVLLDGTNISVQTNEEGRYTLRAVPLGQATVRAIMIGFDMGRAVVSVTAAGVQADFELTRAVVNLDEIVVTATGEQRRREVSNAVTSLAAAEVVEAVMPVNVGSLIQGRAAGVQIINASGTTGASQQIRIRGSSSISLSNEPLLVVDGIRVENDASSLGQGVGGQSISAMNDFNPDEIESIEIVKGPSAAALFGTEAANGVIVIKTKRGRVGRPVWTAYTEQGILQEVTTFPNNYRGIDASGASCRLLNIAAGTCTHAGIETANPLESATTAPFQTGYRQQYGLSVNGGSENVQYFVSGEWEVENGIYGLPDRTRDSIVSAGGTIPSYAENPNRLERGHIRANLQARLGEKADLRVSTGFVSSDIWLPQNDNNVLGMLPSGLLGGTDSTVVGGWGFYTPEEVFFVETKQAVERFTSSINTSWKPTYWLEVHGTAGLDLSERRDFGFQATGTGPDFGTGRQGNRGSDRTSILRYTLDAGATAQFQLSSDLTSKTTAAVQYFRRNLEQVETTGEILAPGSGSNKSASNQFIDEDFAESITLGTYVEQQFAFKDRLFVTGALRADDNSAFGQDFSVTVYPKVGASFLAIDQGLGLLDNLRFRAAYGASGQQPGGNDAVKFLVGSAIIDDGGEKVGVTINNGGAGNPLLKPERSAEMEGGFDLGLFGGRASLEATYYRRTTSDALIQRRLAPSIGLTQDRFENIGETLNQGFEAIVNASILQGNALSWDMTISGSTNSNEIVELGEGVEPIVFGSRKHTEGYPLGAFFDEAYSFEDTNGDGVIELSEMNYDLDGDGSTDSTVFFGYPLPRYEASWLNTFSLFSGRVRLSGLWDYRGGHKKFNLTEAFRCGFNTCEGLNDPSLSLAEQAAAQTRRGGPGTDAGFLEPGWFVKLREISLTFSFPQSWARAVRTDRLSLTFTGRNLATITDYKGSDPEVEESVNNFGSRDFLTQPQVRYFLARLNVSF